VVLGIAPTTVARPQGVRPLVMSIVAASKDTGFPRNYSVEIAPYWLGSPALSFLDYYRRTPRNLYRQLSVSVATTPLGDSGSDGTAIGLGVRTLPLPGNPHPQLAALETRLHRLQAARQKLIGTNASRPRLIDLLHDARAASADALVDVLNTRQIDAIVDDMRTLDRNRVRLEIQIADLEEEAAADRSLPEAERTRRAEQRKSALGELNQKRTALEGERRQLATRLMTEVQTSQAVEHLATASALDALATRLDQAQSTDVKVLDDDMRDTALKIQALDRQRVGPMLAVATATAVEIPGNRTSQTSLAAAAVWVTPGYRFLMCPTGEDSAPCSSSFDALAVVRYRDDRRLPEHSSAWELGARAIWQPVRPFAISVEWVGRPAADDNRGSRAVGAIEFELNPSAFVYASFGRDFQEPGVRRNLVSAIGLTFGFGKKPIVEPAIPR